MKEDKRKPRRQGDVILIPVSEEAIAGRKLVSKPDRVILEGEHSGHFHKLQEGLAGEVLVADNNLDEMWVKAEKGTRLVHEEHAPHDLEEGLWRVIRQREYAEDSPLFVVD